VWRETSLRAHITAKAGTTEITYYARCAVTILTRYFWGITIVPLDSLAICVNNSSYTGVIQTNGDMPAGVSCPVAWHREKRDCALTLADDELGDIPEGLTMTTETISGSM